MSTQESGKEVQPNQEPNKTSSGSEVQTQPKGQKSLAIRLTEESPIHNFTGTKQEIWRKLALCSGSACRGKDDQPPEGIEVVNFMAHRIEMVNQQTGEVTEPTRIVLVTPNNEAYGFVSDFLADSLDMLIAAFGNGPWEPPIKLRVNEQKTRKGFKVLTIDPK